VVTCAIACNYCMQFIACNKLRAINCTCNHGFSAECRVLVREGRVLGDEERLGGKDTPTVKSMGWTDDDSGESTQMAYRHVQQGVGKRTEMKNQRHPRKQVVKVIPSRIAAARGRFSRIRQVVPMCNPSNTQTHSLVHTPVQMASRSVDCILTDRSTDRPCYSICNSRPHLPTYVELRCDPEMFK